VKDRALTDQEIDVSSAQLLGTILALAFYPIKNRMDHAFRRFAPQRDA
jgi:hypothetical protein